MGCLSPEPGKGATSKGVMPFKKRKTEGLRNTYSGVPTLSLSSAAPCMGEEDHSGSSRSLEAVDGSQMLFLALTLELP